MSLIAALETSVRPPSVAIRDESGVFERRLEEDARHASDLLPTLAGVMEERGHAARDLSLICVGIGPGSYTGLRVGIATALGLSRGTGAPIVAVPSVAAWAYAALEPGQEATLLIDARANELYFARYLREEHGVTELAAPRVTTAAELPELLPATGVILADEAGLRAAQLGDADVARTITDHVPTASAVLSLALERFEREGASLAEDIAPLYLRPFAASKRKR
ncbi:MAG: tRNA (adenosine(37)-N6)-threonylcarbamoyltransferase complex dimerization subunit type 1 TsaB [Planctomycetota bacterium]|nr:tRNA (adenosine(37)-N6)-threonylcarbamoyltransferase complex dimerization subunit type 1 TsaB [Planctomycetota bacterium]